MKIFISHSSKDKFVKSFVDFLTSLGINPNDIFCSSLEGQGVKNGTRINDSVRKEFNASDLKVYLISHNFLESTYCVQELGALWSLGDDKPHFIFKFEDVNDNDIKGFVDSSYKYNLVNTDGMACFYDEVADLFKLQNKQAVISRAINTLLTNIKKEVTVLVEDKDKTSKELEAEKVKNLEKQFDDLSIGEKKIIGSIYFSENAVGYYSISNGTIGLLLSKLFLVRTANISTGFQQFPYALQPWARAFIKNNKKVQNELLNLIKNKGGYIQDDPFNF